jgi:hypothetical protein
MCTAYIIQLFVNGMSNYVHEDSPPSDAAPIQPSLQYASFGAPCLLDYSGRCRQAPHVQNPTLQRGNPHKPSWRVIIISSLKQYFYTAPLTNCSGPRRSDHFMRFPLET